MKLLQKIKSKFAKKFEVRVVYHLRNNYKIEWCEYRLLKNWQTILKWHHLSDPNYSGMCWNPELLPYNKAIEFAKTLTSIEKIREYHKEQNKIKDKWITKRREYLAKTNPVKEETIIQVEYNE